MRLSIQELSAQSRQSLMPSEHFPKFNILVTTFFIRKFGKIRRIRGSTTYSYVNDDLKNNFFPSIREEYFASFILSTILSTEASAVR